MSAYVHANLHVWWATLLPVCHRLQNFTWIIPPTCLNLRWRSTHKPFVIWVTHFSIWQCFEILMMKQIFLFPIKKNMMMTILLFLWQIYKMSTSLFVFYSGHWRINCPRFTPTLEVTTMSVFFLPLLMKSWRLSWLVFNFLLWISSTSMYSVTTTTCIWWHKFLCPRTILRPFFA